jgi:hypothetical protein
VNLLYGRFNDSLVLVRLFNTCPIGGLSDEDWMFVQLGGGRRTTPISSMPPLLYLPCSVPGGCGRSRTTAVPQRTSALSPCFSSAYVSSLSMLSRQFECVGLDLGLIDDWETRVASVGRADRYRGMLYIGDEGNDRETHGRMIVPR